MKAYLVLRMQKEFKTNAFPICLETKDTWGACMVYKTKAKAQKVWGKDIQLAEIDILKSADKQE